MRVHRRGCWGPYQLWERAAHLAEREARQKRLLTSIRAVNDESSSLRGARFFDTLAARLADVLGADLAFVGQLGLDGACIDMVSIHADGKRVEPFSYALAGTPCAQVLEKRQYSHTRDVAKLFPDDVVLAEMGIHAYVGVPLRDANGAAVGILVALFRHDLDDVEFAESVLLFFAPRAALEVQQARSDTERERAEVALQEANARLLDVDRHKNEFLAVLSHELRNPLSPIKNSLYILDRAAPDSPQAERAKAVIGRQVDQLARLVEDLMDLTRAAQNKIQLQHHRLDLNDLVRRAAEDHRLVFEGNGQRLEVDLAPAEVFICADPARMTQVVGNLLANAAKFTQPGGRTSVSVSVDAATGHVVLRVADTGSGMAPESLSRLFQPFMQVDATLDRSRGGLGLGLALVKRLLELHGGDISVHSAGLGKGTEFVVRLPLDVAGASEVQAGPPSAARHRRRVLIVEDNVDAALSLQEALELDDHEVAVAYNGPDSLTKAREFHPEVILCDVGLPGMDGYEVARAVRADVSLRGAMLVALTGYALPDDLRRASEAGFERHMAKPPNLEKLERLLAEPRRGAA
jgi:two-component system CheB/CheR fusion protein